VSVSALQPRPLRVTPNHRRAVCSCGPPQSNRCNHHPTHSYFLRHHAAMPAKPKVKPVWLCEVHGRPGNFTTKQLGLRRLRTFSRVTARDGFVAMTDVLLYERRVSVPSLRSRRVHPLTEWHPKRLTLSSGRGLRRDLRFRMPWGSLQLFARFVAWAKFRAARHLPPYNVWARESSDVAMHLRCDSRTLCWSELGLGSPEENMAHYSARWQEHHRYAQGYQGLPLRYRAILAARRRRRPG
jgi:hypothetical protein